MIKFIKRADIFNHKFHFNVNGNKAVYTLEGGVLSILYYTLSMMVFFFNMISTYSSNSPFFANQILLRNLSQTEIVPQADYNLAFGVYIADYVDANIKILVPIEPDKFMNKDIEMFNSYYTFIPTYKYRDEVAGFAENCYKNPDFSEPNILINTICLNFTKPTYEQGGYIMSTGFEYTLETKVNSGICEFIDIREYYKLLFSNQLDVEGYKKNCTQDLTTNYNPVTIGLKYNSDLLDIETIDGYNRFPLTKYQEYDYYSQKLRINIELTKNTIITDPNSIYNFFPSVKNVFYSKEITFNFLPKSIPDDNLDVRFKFVINEFENVINRSYNKIDNVLANILSVVQLIYIFFFCVMHFLSHNSLENEIIRSLYYEDPSEQTLADLIVRRNSALPIIRKSIISNKQQQSSNLTIKYIYFRRRTQQQQRH